MNDNTAKLLEQLAQRLGTTSEYLWKVLIKQAPISATVDLFQFFAIIIFGYLLFRVHKYLMRKEDTGSYAETRYEKYEVGAVFPMAIGCIAWLILFIISFCCLGDVISGYFNPEFWALQKVLNSVR